MQDNRRGSKHTEGKTDIHAVANRRFGETKTTRYKFRNTEVLTADAKTRLRAQRFIRRQVRVRVGPTTNHLAFWSATVNKRLTKVDGCLWIR